MPKLYGELADWWPLFSRPSDYEEEAAFALRVLREAAEREVRDVLELGSGGGNNASHMKEHLSLTLVDPSPAMLDVSRALNPECRHVQGDMRTVRLSDAFDAVFVHDAVMYMTTEDDLRAAMTTAFHHLRPGGAALFVPDETREIFEASTEHGGHDADGRSLRYLQWAHPPVGTTYVLSFAILTREGDGPVRCTYDEHTFGLFERATWLELLNDVGFESGSIRYETDDWGREVFVGVRLAGVGDGDRESL